MTALFHLNLGGRGRLQLQLLQSRSREDGRARKSHDLSSRTQPIPAVVFDALASSNGSLWRGGTSSSGDVWTLGLGYRLRYVFFQCFTADWCAPLAPHFCWLCIHKFYRQASQQSR